MTELEKTIEKYLNGTLTGEELRVFQEQLTSDTQLQADLITYQEMQAAFDQEDWPLNRPSALGAKAKSYQDFLESDAGREVKSGISNAERTYFEKEKTPVIKRFSWLYATAAILTLAIAAWFIFSKGSTTPSDLFAHHQDWSDLPSLTVRGDQNELAQGEQLFKAKKFGEALTLFSNYTATNAITFNTQLALYQGICYLELNNYEQAINIFQKISTSSSLDAGKAKWYLALSYLKGGQIPQSKAILNQIVSSPDNYKFRAARDLMSQLE